jgi:hypothetical protein
LVPPPPGQPIEGGLEEVAQAEAFEPPRHAVGVDVASPQLLEALDEVVVGADAFLEEGADVGTQGSR